MKKEKVIFLDTVHPVLKERLEKLGYECTEAFLESYDEIAQKIGDYEGLVIRSRIPIDRHLLDRAGKLKFIARSGAGMENIDFNHAKQLGIQCINAPEGNRDAVGEHAIGMLLSLFNHLHTADRETRQGIWKREENRGIELMGKTVGIIGYGNTGGAFARKLSGFDCRLLVYDKYRQGFGNEKVEEADMSLIFQEADIVSLHIPLTTETDHLVNADFIHQFKKNFFLINTSRGRIVNTGDLVSGMKEGKVAGACLDVLEYESKSFELQNGSGIPPAYDYLSKSNKVILSPHVAGWTRESWYKLSSVLADKIEAAFHA